MKRHVCKVLGVAFLAGDGMALANDNAIELEAMEVMGVTPLPGSDVPVDKIPANIQTVTSEEFQNAQAISLAEFTSMTPKIIRYSLIFTTGVLSLHLYWACRKVCLPMSMAFDLMSRSAIQLTGI